MRRNDGEKSKFSKARKAADQHSIIFEEDLDSEGDLDTSTYKKFKVDDIYGMKEEDQDN